MSEVVPTMASSSNTTPALQDAAELLANNTGASLPTNTSNTDPPPSSSPQPPESTPPPDPPTSPPPAPPTSPPPANKPPPPDSPPPAPPTSSPPPPSPSPSPPPPSPPPSSPPPSPTSPPPSSPPLSPPPPGAALPPPLTPVFSPPPPKSIISQTPPAPNSSPSDNKSHYGTPFGPSPSSSSDSTIHGLMIAGIVVGAVVIITLCIVIACLLFLKKRQKPQGSQYYMDPSRQPKVGEQQYYNDPTQWHNRPMDQNIPLPHPGGFMGAQIGGWGGPPPANNSSDFSSGYSGQHQMPSSPNMGGITQFSYEDLAAATSGFSQANLLGQGGFGYVHKGILPDRRVVACKSLKSGSGQGEREFRAEVEIISRVHHRHLVSLVGYCIANQQRMLVYEFVPNKTLEFHLHGKGQPVFEWATRLRIAVGSAKGLAYLHEDCLPRIIHRDIKTANILLDNNFEAMVSDFGLAKLTSDNFTHVSTRVMGTFGYLAPEYASSGKLTEKSDVFSFGVMLLELITGRRPVDTSNRFMEDSLVDWARPLLSKVVEDGNYDQLVDPRLEGNYVPHEMARMIACAAASIRHSARKRPKMSQIVRALEGDSSLEDLNEGVKPGQSAMYNPNGGSEAYDTRAYNADMLKFKKMVMSSTEFNSSEYGATSEYGVNPSPSGGEYKEMGNKADLDIDKP